MLLAQKMNTQMSGIEDPEKNPHSKSHLIFEKDAKNLCWRKVSLFNKWSRET
jgi:hypothetical protein